MNEIVKNCLKEIVRVILAALLAAVGLESAGCIACGDGSASAFVTYGNTKGEMK